MSTIYRQNTHTLSDITQPLTGRPVISQWMRISLSVYAISVRYMHCMNDISFFDIPPCCTVTALPFIPTICNLRRPAYSAYFHSYIMSLSRIKTDMFTCVGPHVHVSGLTFVNYHH